MLEGKNILMVDDQEHNLELYSYIFKLKNSNIVLASGGQEALDILAQQKIDLIILDIMMPGMNGYKVLEKIKTDDKTKDIPVIVASAFNEKSHKEKALEKGAELYLGKPIDIDLLVEKSEEVLKKQSEK